MNKINPAPEKVEVKEENVSSMPPVNYALGTLSALCMLGGFVLTVKLWPSNLEYWQRDDIFVYIPALQPLATSIITSVVFWSLAEIIKCLHQIIKK